MTKWTAAMVAVVWLLVPAFGDDHGQHHEELSQQQLGSVHFPVSCSPEAQKRFERGVALLHSFWYEEAEKEFEDIARKDSKCAMASWGIAFSLWHQLWNRPDAKTIKTANDALRKGRALKAVTPREGDYLAAISVFYENSEQLDHQARAEAYAKAMEKMYIKYPDDREAAAFYALSLLAAEPDNDTTFAKRKKAAEVLEKLFLVEPDHPGVAHYLIHSYDKPQLAELGVPAARRYAQIAPAAPHALHMPSHIFARIGLWQDDINSNLASIAATRKTAAMHMGGEGHQFHAMDFLVYAYLQTGREAEAQKVIDEVKAMTPMKDMYGMGFDPRTYALSKFPALYDLELRRWSDAAALKPVAEASRGNQSITYLARAIGAARSGNLQQAHADVKEIESIHQKLLDDKRTIYAEEVEHDRQVAQAWIAHAEKHDDEAIKLLRSIAETEEAVGEEPMGIPAREMLADLLLEGNKPDLALMEYEKDLKFNPKRFNGLYGAGKAAELLGNSQKATEYYTQLVNVCEGSSSDRQELTRAKQLLAKK